MKSLVVNPPSPTVYVVLLSGTVTVSVVPSARFRVIVCPLIVIALAEADNACAEVVATLVPKAVVTVAAYDESSLID